MYTDTDGVTATNDITVVSCSPAAAAQMVDEAQCKSMARAVDEFHQIGEGDPELSKIYCDKSANCLKSKLDTLLDQWKNDQRTSKWLSGLGSSGQSGFLTEAGQCMLEQCTFYWPQIHHIVDEVCVSSCVVVMTWFRQAHAR